jgi:hypothetical protein
MPFPEEVNVVVIKVVVAVVSVEFDVVVVEVDVVTLIFLLVTVKSAQPVIFVAAVIK